jgi:hypothetical protein
MITLDEHQERVLADVAQIIRRSRGNKRAAQFLKGARRIAIFGLSMHRFFMPRHFQRWDRQRIAEYRGAAK